MLFSYLEDDAWLHGVCKVQVKKIQKRSIRWFDSHQLAEQAGAGRQNPKHDKIAA